MHTNDRADIASLTSPWTFAACWIGATLLLYWAGSPLTGPAVFPDEVCRLGWARLLSGTGPHFDILSQAAYCQPYYPLLLAPVQWLTDDPATVQRAVFAINSALAAACLPLAVRLGVRHFGLGAATAWIAGLAILAYPSLTLYSSHALPETMLFPAILVALALWCNWVDRPTWRAFWALLAMGIVLYALHRKMLVVPMVMMGGAFVGYWSHRTPEYRIRMLVTTLALAVAFFLDEMVKSASLSGHIAARDAGAIDMMARLFSLEHIPTIAGKIAGTLVYATLVTGGCIWLLLGGGLDSIRRGIRSGFGSLDAFDKKSAFAFAMVVMLLGVTAIATGTARFDLWFYGRHVDATLGVALLPAIAMIARARVNGAALWWAIALVVVAFLILATIMPGPPWSDLSPFHVIGAGPVMEWMHQAQNRWTLLAYCAGILVIVAIMYLACLPSRLRFAALAPFGIVVTSIHLTTQPFAGLPVETAISESAAKVLRTAEPCHIHFDERNGGRLRGHQIFRVQYYFPNCSFEIVPPAHPLEPDSLVIVIRELANCGPARECHELHPDLVLYQTSGE